MTRRDFVYLSGSSLALAGIASPLAGFAQSTRPVTRPTLFFHPDDLDRIRANTRSELLSPLYQTWSEKPPGELTKALDRFEASGDFTSDFLVALESLTENAFLQILEPTATRRDALLDAVARLIDTPHWDYFRDGPDDVIGLQRGPMATVRLLFAREAIWDDLSPALDQRLLSAVADKGCVSCYNAVHGMDNPDTVKGWRFSERHEGFYDLDMSRWPMILGANNLRADPSGSLGIGALALRGIDPRAELWLDTALASARRVMQLFGPDGSFFEGISYAEYTLRTCFNFFDAHQREIGPISWMEEVKLDGFIDFILSMQAGRKPSGAPDIVNFGDAGRSVVPCVPSWIARQTGSPLAQYAAQNASEPRNFLDFLWYQPERPSAPPPDSLKNVRNDLDWILCRSGWQPDDAVLAFRSGGPSNHEHADRNSFLFKIHGERLLNDPFGAGYDWRDPKWALRLTRGHNGVLIDGQGHHYHKGEEGTNDSLSYANVLQFEEKGDVVWWTSDATAAYRITNYHIFKVLRTVVFAKPDIVIVLDQVRLRYRPQPVSLRFFPDNRDDAATLRTNGSSFEIARPNARLNGKSMSRSEALGLQRSQLDIPDEFGSYPCVEITSGDALSHEILTAFVATEATAKANPDIQITATPDGWKVQANAFTTRIQTSGHTPAISVRSDLVSRSEPSPSSTTAIAAQGRFPLGPLFD